MTCDTRSGGERKDAEKEAKAEEKKRRRRRRRREEDGRLKRQGEGNAGRGELKKSRSNDDSHDRRSVFVPPANHPLDEGHERNLGSK